MAIRDCILDVQQANEIFDLAAGDRDRPTLLRELADYLSAGDREIIPMQDPGLQSYAQALIQSQDIRTRFLEYAILRGAACLRS